MQKDRDPEVIQLAGLIRNTRLYLGYKQEQVSAAVGISRAGISMTETGKREVGAIELRRMAGFFGVPINYFLSEPDGLVPNSQFADTKDLPEDEKREIVNFAGYLRTRPSSLTRSRPLNVEEEERRRIIEEIGIDKALQLEATSLNEEGKKELIEYVDFRKSKIKITDSD